MKVIIKNLDKKCSEYIECTHIKIDDQRLMFIWNRVTSLLIPKSIDKIEIAAYMQEKFLRNKDIGLCINAGGEKWDLSTL